MVETIHRAQLPHGPRRIAWDMRRIVNLAIWHQYGHTRVPEVSRETYREDRRSCSRRRRSHSDSSAQTGAIMATSRSFHPVISALTGLGVAATLAVIVTTSASAASPTPAPPSSTAISASRPVHRSWVRCRARRRRQRHGASDGCRGHASPADPTAVPTEDPTPTASALTTDRFAATGRTSTILLGIAGAAMAAGLGGLILIRRRAQTHA